MSARRTPAHQACSADEGGAHRPEALELRPTYDAKAQGGHALQLPSCGAAALLVAGVAVIYCRTLQTPFLLDDHLSIERNGSLNRLWPLTSALSPPNQAGVGGRPLLNLSFALNHALGGASVAGYHAVNLVIHACAAVVLFALVRRTLRLPILAPRYRRNSTVFALLIAAAWAWHPLQTESVTYLSQRAESLMGLFYLLTLYGFSRGWHGLSVIACLAGMATKEVIVTAPLAVLLYDRAFLSPTFAACWRRHWPVLTALAATWLPLADLMAGLTHRGAGLGTGISPWTYALAECQVVLRYLGLAVWPHPLVFDYGMDLTFPTAASWACAGVVLLLLAGTFVLWRRNPPAGFAAISFFLLLAPTSTFIPVAGQPMAESRMYLPLAPLTVLLVLLVERIALDALSRRPLATRKRMGAMRSTLLIAPLALLTFARNRDYASELRIWSDTVAKNPGSARAHDNLGYALASAGRAEDALGEYDRALALRPDFAEAHENRASALSSLGRSDEAISECRTAERLDPHNPDYPFNLGNLLAGQGRPGEAAVQFQASLRLSPGNAAAHYDLANALKRLPGRRPEAIAHYEEALRLKPDFAAAHLNLATTLLQDPARRGDALAELRRVLQLDPGNASARHLLSAFSGEHP